MQPACFRQDILPNFQRAQGPQLVFVFRIWRFNDFLVVVVKILGVEVFVLAFFVARVICNKVVELLAFFPLLSLLCLLEESSRMIVDQKKGLEIAEESTTRDFATSDQSC